MRDFYRDGLIIYKPFEVKTEDVIISFEISYTLIMNTKLKENIIERYFSWNYK